jgi:hypothetical protein
VDEWLEDADEDRRLRRIRSSGGAEYGNLEASLEEHSNGGNHIEYAGSDDGPTQARHHYDTTEADTHHHDDTADHDTADHDTADHDTADHDTADHDTADHDTADHDTADHDVRPCRGLLLARRCNWSDGERDPHDMQDVTYRQPRSLAIAVARVQLRASSCCWFDAKCQAVA